MIKDEYQYFTDNDHLNYEFISEGSKGEIKKVVQYSKTNIGGIEAYNLGFGDLIDNRINDTAVSNNGDMSKVLTTVASTIYDFTSHHKEKWIYAKGSTPVRTLLYQRKLNHGLDEISTDFEVYGLKKEGWEEFRKGEEYLAFLIKRKQNNIFDDKN